MNPNSYRVQDEDEVYAQDIAALLAELQDVGGSVTEAGRSVTSGRPWSGTTARRGVVGGTNVLWDQQQSSHMAAAGLGHARRVSGGNATTNAAASATAASNMVLAPLGFSTYDSVDAAKATEALNAKTQATQLSATPLGVRLTPLPTSAVGGSVKGGTQLSPRAGFVPSLPPCKQGRSSLDGRSSTTAPDKYHGCGDKTADTLAALPATPVNATKRVSLSSQSALPPLPSVKKLSVPATLDDDAGHATKLPSADPAASNSATGAARDINFMPMMCARYLRPVGLTPTARWGHTLTTVHPDMILLFGGVDAYGTETASLMAFNATTIAWEPLYSLTEPPAARHSHAACAYEGRYLVISGGVAVQGGRVFNDVHVYDTYTHQWRCAWSGELDGPAGNRQEPGPRFGHSVVLVEDRLHLYGGKIVPSRPYNCSSEASTAPPSDSTTTPNALNATATAALAKESDVYVFSMSSFRWRRRLHTTKERRTSSTAPSDGAPHVEPPSRPPPRAYHAACVRGNTMFVNGGAGAGADGVWTDTWAVDLQNGQWRCIHRGGTADAVPREKHALFVCGEGLLLVGGCSATSDLAERLTGRFTHFAVVLPLVGQAVDTPCWIPVAMGYLSIAAPHKKSFAATLSGGFVYVFGGVCGAEPATNTMVRFLATDGCVSEHDQTAQVSGGDDTSAQQLRLMMQQLREQQRGTPFDCYAYAGTYGSLADVAAVVAQLPTAWTSSADSNAATTADSETARRSAKADVPALNLALVGWHRAIVHQRAPLLLQDLEGCRADSYLLGNTDSTGAAGKSPRKQSGRNAVSAGQDDDSGDAVDALVQRVTGVVQGQRGAAVESSSTAAPTATVVNTTTTPHRGANHSSHSTNPGSTSDARAASGVPVYYTNGTSRIAGLAHALTAEALQCLTDYVYWGGLKGTYRALLEEDRVEAEENYAAGTATGQPPSEGALADEEWKNGGESPTTHHSSPVSRRAAGSASACYGSSPSTGTRFSGEYRHQLVSTLETVRAAASCYQLLPLVNLCDGLLAGSRSHVRAARQRSSEQLRSDLASLLATAQGANTTMLVVDPHTKAQSAHVLHASVLMASSDLFTELLRPLFRASAGLGGGKSVNQVGPLAAKLRANAAQAPLTLLTSTSKRTVLIGPVALPLPAVRPIVRYLYTQELQMSPGTAFEVLLGAHQLGLTELQALCEAVVAREEVNYQTCCSFYYLARKYQASFLEEVALLTAVSGYAEIRYTAAYQSLSEEEKLSIDAVANELGSANWVPPPSPRNEMKPKSTYAARWEASAAPLM